ncbi:basic proline-rich protein-like [Colius striatus]|uniref:basic proline-rich protein-like n=1 Tax=Colius striatus TaxID=57412 RepID=UPI002B1D6B94|nr:basic proline-rich protein-like [Colius striatus]
MNPPLAPAPGSSQPPEPRQQPPAGTQQSRSLPPALLHESLEKPAGDEGFKSLLAYRGQELQSPLCSGLRVPQPAVQRFDAKDGQITSGSHLSVPPQCPAVPGLLTGSSPKPPAAEAPRVSIRSVRPLQPQAAAAAVPNKVRPRRHPPPHSCPPTGPSSGRRSPAGGLHPEPPPAAPRPAPAAGLQQLRRRRHNTRHSPGLTPAPTPLLALPSAAPTSRHRLLSARAHTQPRRLALTSALPLTPGRYEKLCPHQSPAHTMDPPLAPAPGSSQPPEPRQQPPAGTQQSRSLPPALLQESLEKPAGDEGFKSLLAYRGQELQSPSAQGFVFPSRLFSPKPPAAEAPRVSIRSVRPLQPQAAAAAVPNKVRPRRHPPPHSCPPTGPSSGRRSPAGGLHPEPPPAAPRPAPAAGLQQLRRRHNTRHSPGLTPAPTPLLALPSAAPTSRHRLLSARAHTQPWRLALTSALPLTPGRYEKLCPHQSPAHTMNPPLAPAPGSSQPPEPRQQPPAGTQQSRSLPPALLHESLEKPAGDEGFKSLLGYRGQELQSPSAQGFVFPSRLFSPKPPAAEAPRVSIRSVRPLQPQAAAAAVPNKVRPRRHPPPHSCPPSGPSSGRCSPAGGLQPEPPPAAPRPAPAAGLRQLRRRHNTRHSPGLTPAPTPLLALPSAAPTSRHRLLSARAHTQPWRLALTSALPLTPGRYEKLCPHQSPAHTMNPPLAPAPGSSQPPKPRQQPPAGTQQSRSLPHALLHESLEKPAGDEGFKSLLAYRGQELQSPSAQGFVFPSRLFR